MTSGPSADDRPVAPELPAAVAAACFILAGLTGLAPIEDHLALAGLFGGTGLVAAAVAVVKLANGRWREPAPAHTPPASH